MQQHDPSNPHSYTDKQASKLTLARAHPCSHTDTNRQTQTQTDNQTDRHTHTHTNTNNTQNACAHTSSMHTDTHTEEHCIEESYHTRNVKTILKFTLNIRKAYSYCV